MAAKSEADALTVSCDANRMLAISSVLCFYYLIKVLQLLLFSMIGVKYDYFFEELLTTNENVNVASNVVQNDFECAIDFNGLFIGGTIQTFLGIFLGMTHAYLCAPSIYDVKNFYPVTFWKCSALKHGKKFLVAKRFLEKNYDVRNITLRYGIWPLFLLFGTKPKSSKESNNGLERMCGPVFKTLTLDQKSLLHAHRRWKFRRIFWSRWLQLTVLGTPSLFFYTIESKNSLRAGSIMYGFITCSLLLLYKELNQKLYLKYLLNNFENDDSDDDNIDDNDHKKHHHRDVHAESWEHHPPLLFDVSKNLPTSTFSITHMKSPSVITKTHDLSLRYHDLDINNDNNHTNDNAERPDFSNKTFVQKDLSKGKMDIHLMIFEQNLELSFNSYDVIYSVWIATSVTLIAFQAIPFLTSFYKVIISSLFIIFFSFAFAYFDRFLNMIDHKIVL